MTTDPALLETRIIGASRVGQPWLVFLHEGLGCVTLWHDFPDRLCALTGLGGLVYSRRGYGHSPALEGPLKPSFMHAAAGEELPALLAHHRISRPVLVGHSDGASIAIIHAAQAAHDVQAVIAIAPHLFVESIAQSAIAQLRQRVADDASRLDALHRHHANGRALFDAWTSAWLEPAFTAWSIETETREVHCPMLAVQGRDDQYGTLAQIERLLALAPQSEACIIEACRHHPHREATLELLNACQAFLGRCLPTEGVP